MKFNKDDIYSIIGTLLFHAVILLILWFSVIKTVIPDENGGVIVNFGNVDEAAGTFEPQYTGEVPPDETTVPPPPSEPQAEPSKQDLVTQDVEETVAIKDTKKKKEESRKQEEEKRKRETEEKERIQKENAEKKRIAEEQRKQQAINNRVAGAFGIGSAKGNSQGTGKGTGNQGSPFGNSDHGANTGVGGMGTFSLSGRQIITGKVAEPSYTEKEEGQIVINITVDPRGNVIAAEIGRGTTIDDVSMRSKAIRAARSNKFNEITGVNNQQGRITYKYRLR